MKERFKSLISEYGSIAFLVYLAIFVCTIVGFAAAISAGMDVEGAAETTGLWGAAWLATKLTQPLRIAATAVLTPLVAAVWHRTPWGRRALEARRAAARQELAEEQQGDRPELNDPEA